MAVAAALLGCATAGCADGETTSDTAPATVESAPASTTATTHTSTADTSTADTSTTVPATVLPARLETNATVDEIAGRLSANHATIVDTSAPPDDRARAGVEFQLALRQLADRADLDEAVLAALDPTARPAVEEIVRARQFLQTRSASRPAPPLPDELPAWTIVEPDAVDTLLATYAEAEQLTGIPWYWLAAIHLQETRMGRIQGISSAGAVGPMQFLPTTWEVCCAGDPTVTRDAIIGAATYLAQSGGPDDMAAALYQYNPNDGYVAVVTAYATSLRDEPELYVGYHAFQVFFGSSAGTVRLPIGYSETAPVDAAGHLASNPQDAAGR
jgi:membrane-bound lytic murein transglycosylase B